MVFDQHYIPQKGASIYPKIPQTELFIIVTQTNKNYRTHNFLP